jgi:hypothetical protein
MEKSHVYAAVARGVPGMLFLAVPWAFWWILDFSALRFSRGPDLSPDSDSLRKAPQKSGLGSKFGLQKYDITSISRV